ncbi:MAG TPA: hypothetical protein ENK75_03315 [Saprospiraceae bacterium]|nr:hypothetical protein [Saprospiraceae bacterium]
MKKIFTLFLVLSSLFLYNNIFSQGENIESFHHPRLDTFKIQNYILPDIGYKSLALGFDFNSNNLTKLNLYYNDTYKYHVNSGINLKNYNYKNNRRLIYKGIDRFMVLGNIGKYDRVSFLSSDIRKDKIYSRNGFITVSTERDYKFYKTNKFFYELDLNSNVGLNSNYSDVNNDINKNHGFNFSIQPAFSLGKGRIEDVTDAWHIIRILKDFSRTKVLKKTPTDEDIIVLANAISKTRYKRYFDYRIKRMENIKFIDTIIRERQLVSNYDADYFTSLYDMYQYGALFSRYSGSYFSGGLVPFANYRYLSGFDISKNVEYCIGLQLKYEYQKPLNQFWQFDFGANFLSNFTLYKFEADDIITKKTYLEFFPRIDISISYYPTTRTWCRSSFFVFYNDKLDLENNAIGNDNRIVSGLRNSLNYYISPRLRLDFNFNIYYGSNSYLLLNDNDFNFDPIVYGGLYSLKKGINYLANVKANYYFY